AADVHGDFRLGHGLDPAGKRYASSRLNARIARQKSHQRSGDVEALEHRRRGEAHLPAQRRVAGVKTLAPQLELRPGSAICFGARQDRQLPDPCIADAGARRSAGHAGFAAVSSRELDQQAARLERAGVPAEYRTARTKPEMALAEIDRAIA